MILCTCMVASTNVRSPCSRLYSNAWRRGRQVSERDILGTQLIKRNDELSQLYEKIKIQQCTLNRGEQAFSERISDLGTARQEQSALKSELQVDRCR